MICVRHITRLYAENEEELYAYAAFINDSTAYVLNALVETLKKDPDYKAWRADNPNAYAPARAESQSRKARVPQRIHNGGRGASELAPVV